MWYRQALGAFSAGENCFLHKRQVRSADVCGVELSGEPAAASHSTFLSLRQTAGVKIWFCKRQVLALSAYNIEHCSCPQYFWWLQQCLAPEPRVKETFREPVSAVDPTTGTIVLIWSAILSSLPHELVNNISSTHTSMFLNKHPTYRVKIFSTL